MGKDDGERGRTCEQGEIFWVHSNPILLLPFDNISKFTMETMSLLEEGVEIIVSWCDLATTPAALIGMGWL
jgi:hypothetical protein